MKAIALTVIGLFIVLAGLSVLPALGQAPPMRFDHVVRDDFFAGLRGDTARLVFHGSGLSVLSGQAFRRGDLAAAGELFERGLREMNEAAAIAPRDTVVLLLRGITLADHGGDRGVARDAAVVSWPP